MWGSCCFNKGDVKVDKQFNFDFIILFLHNLFRQVTLGTGSFLNVNTGPKCHASVHGLYPLVAWRWRNREQKSDELIYCVEGASSDTGSIIKWALDFGKFVLHSKPTIENSLPNSFKNRFIC